MEDSQSLGRLQKKAGLSKGRQLRLTVALPRLEYIDNGSICFEVGNCRYFGRRAQLAVGVSESDPVRNGQVVVLNKRSRGLCVAAAEPGK